jgi:hypothetical protein
MKSGSLNLLEPSGPVTGLLYNNEHCSYSYVSIKRDFGTHHLRGTDRLCERSEVDENTVVNQKTRKAIRVDPRSFTVLGEEKLAVCSKIGLHHTNFGMPRRGVLKISMGNYLFTVGT